MATVWLTYAWRDNEHQDVDFYAQELEQKGLTVKLDRWNIEAGARLWEQIEKFIAEADAWVLVASPNSLHSEPCKEEYAYALDRALRARGTNFPVIALSPGPTDADLLPAGLRTRLCVSATDPDWKERIAAAAEGRPHQVSRRELHPYALTVHSNQVGSHPFAIEVRPRAGTWPSFVAAIPAGEAELVGAHVIPGPSNYPTKGGMVMASTPEKNGDWLVLGAEHQCTPINSMYIWCKQLPTKLVFGVNNGPPQYQVTMSQSGPSATFTMR